MPRLSPAVPIAGAAFAALAAVTASRLVSPGLIIAGVLGLIALLSLRANLQTALLGLAFGRATLEGTYLLPAANVGGVALGLGDILTLGFFGGALWYLAGRARAGTLGHLWRAPTVVPMLLFLAVAAFSLLYSPDATQGARDILKLASAFSAYLLLVADPPDARRLRLLLIGITVGSIVPILAGVGLLLTGGAEVNEFQGWSRVQSVFVDPNAYGIYLVTVLAAAWALRGEISGIARSWLDVLSVAAFVSVFLTLSRNSVAALAILVLVIGMRRRKILIAAVGLTVIVLLASPQVGSRGTQILSPKSRAEGQVGRGANATRTALVGRVEIWEEGLGLWRQRPFLGIGFGGTSVAVGNNAHNDYLRSLVEAGLVGLACFLAVIVSIIRLGLRAGAGRSDAPRLLMGLSLGYVLVSYFANNLGKNVFQFHFWLLAGILYVWAQKIPISRPSSERVRQNGAAPLHLRVRLNDGRTVEGFVRSDKLFGDGLLVLTSVTRTFDSEMNEIVVSPLDASLARTQVADFEIIEDSTTASAAAGDDPSEEPEAIPDDRENQRGPAKLEKEKVGPVADQIKEKVKETGQEAFERIKRRTMTDEFLRDVARVYRSNLDNHPREAVADQFTVALSTASRYVKLARDRGLLGKAPGPGRAGER